jgi:hypothetical protein
MNMRIQRPLLALLALCCGSIWPSLSVAMTLTPGPVPVQEDRATSDAYSAAPREGRTTLRPGSEVERQTLVVDGQIYAEREASTLAPYCSGYVSRQVPDLVVRIPEALSSLSLFAQSLDADTVLAVRLPNGVWLCDDDSYGLNPAVILAPVLPGDYTVLVGSYDRETPGTYRLFASFGPPEWDESFAAPVADEPIDALPFLDSAAELVVDAEPAFGVVVLPGARGQATASREVSLAVGTDAYAIDRLGDDCVGYIDPQRPDLRVRLTEPAARLTFVASSVDLDTTLLILDSAQRLYCNDDFIGTDAGMEFSAVPAGEFAVWVGEYYGSPGTVTLTVAVNQAPGDIGTSRADAVPVPADPLRAQGSLAQWIQGAFATAEGRAVAEISPDFRPALESLVTALALHQVLLDGEIALEQTPEHLVMRFARLRVGLDPDFPQWILPDLELTLTRLPSGDLDVHLRGAAEVFLEFQGRPLATLTSAQQALVGQLDPATGRFDSLSLTLQDLQLRLAAQARALGLDPRLQMRLGSLHLETGQVPVLNMPGRSDGHLELRLDDLAVGIDGVGGLRVGQFFSRQRLEQVDIAFWSLLEDGLQRGDWSGLMQAFVTDPNLLQRMVTSLDAMHWAVGVTGVQAETGDAQPVFSLGQMQMSFGLQGLSGRQAVLDLEGGYADLQSALQPFLDHTVQEALGQVLPESLFMEAPADLRFGVRLEAIPGPQVWLEALPNLIADADHAWQVVWDSGMGLRMHLQTSGAQNLPDQSLDVQAQLTLQREAAFGWLGSLQMRGPAVPAWTAAMADAQARAQQEMPDWLARLLVPVEDSLDFLVDLNAAGTLTVSRSALALLMAMGWADR